VAQARLVIVSDTHLSARAPEAQQNWSAVATHIAGVRPDLVIHLGDLTLDGLRVADDLRYGRTQLDQLAAPWRAVPGNHDIGDNLSSLTLADYGVNPLRRQRWIDLIGADWWALDVAGWDLIGINAQLFGSGLPAEKDQWTWLGDQLGGTRSTQPAVLITHKPIAADQEELAAAPPYRFVPSPARRRLSDLLNGRRPCLVLSGHVHQFRRLQIGDATHAYAPTTWAVLPDAAQAPMGIKRCGILSVELDRSGATVALVEPAGVQQLTLGHHLPDPYTR
jgi:predicted MPP superfamily phosphohydrolase